MIVQIALVIVLGGIFCFRGVKLLYLENEERHRILQIRITPIDQFSISYINSIYDEPVTEEFLISRNAIILKGVRTKSPKILEYYGFEDIKDFIKVNRKMEVIIFRVGMEHPQSLVYKERRISLGEIGEKGDQVRMRVKSMPVGYYYLSKILGAI